MDRATAVCAGAKHGVWASKACLGASLAHPACSHAAAHAFQCPPSTQCKCVRSPRAAPPTATSSALPAATAAAAVARPPCFTALGDRSPQPGRLRRACARAEAVRLPPAEWSACARGCRRPCSATVTGLAVVAVHPPRFLLTHVKDPHANWYTKSSTLLSGTWPPSFLFMTARSATQGS